MDFQPQTLIYRPFLVPGPEQRSPICAQEKGGKSEGLRGEWCSSGHSSDQDKIVRTWLLSYGSGGGAPLGLGDGGQSPPVT